MKKVLISLGELQDLLKASYHECCWKDGIPEFTNEHAIKWFDAQPDVGIMSLGELFEHRDRVSREMETTGGKDDN